MSLMIPNKFTVQLLQNEINLLAENYKKSENIKSIEKYFPEDSFVKNDFIHGLWYYFAIFILSSRDAYTISAYEEGFLTLEKIIEDKIWLFQTWSNDSLFTEFNEFIDENISLANLRKSWHTVSELQSFATYGLEMLMKLHNDEKILLYTRLMAFEAVNEMDKEDYQNRIKELELEKKKLELSKLKYKDIYERIVQLRKENSKVSENIRTVIKEFKGKHADLDILFKEKKENFEDVAEHIRQLFYQSKYCKL